MRLLTCTLTKKAVLRVGTKQIQAATWDTRQSAGQIVMVSAVPFQSDHLPVWILDGERDGQRRNLVTELIRRGTVKGKIYWGDWGVGRDGSVELKTSNAKITLSI
jgi:hypothetical protein